MIPVPSKKGFVSPPSDSSLNQDLWRERSFLNSKGSLQMTAMPGGQGSSELLEAIGLNPIAGSRVYRKLLYIRDRKAGQSESSFLAGVKRKRGKRSGLRILPPVV